MNEANSRLAERFSHSDQRPKKREKKEECFRISWVESVKLQRFHLTAVQYLIGFCVICPPKHLKANKANLGG